MNNELSDEKWVEIARDKMGISIEDKPDVETLYKVKEMSQLAKEYVKTKSPEEKERISDVWIQFHSDLVAKYSKRSFSRTVTITKKTKRQKIKK